MEDRFYRATMKIGGGTLLGRLAFAFLVVCSIAFGAAVGLLFVYSSDLPEIHALEDYRPITETELYADDGQSIGSFALQRRILVTYNQIPKILKAAILTTEDQHFEEHWGVDFPRVLQAAWHDILRHRVAEGASTLTMQLAGGLFLDRSDRSFHRKIQETILALQIERHYTKDQIFTMYCNQIYLGSGNYGFEAASEYYFSKPVEQVTLAEAATLAAIIRGPIYSPVNHPERALRPAKPGARADGCAIARSRRGNMRKRGTSRWGCTSNRCATISLRILSRRFANTSNTRMARRPCTRMDCACTRR